MLEVRREGQRAEAAETVAREETEHRLRLQRQLAEAQQREAWWRELWSGCSPTSTDPKRVDRWWELRRLLGLEE